MSMIAFYFFRGEYRIRTDDLLHAMQALYQLSYTPEIWWRIRDSNPGHKDYDSSALTDWANSPFHEVAIIVFFEYLASANFGFFYFLLFLKNKKWIVEL